jgi:hypothetical protein
MGKCQYPNTQTSFLFAHLAENQSIPKCVSQLSGGIQFLELGLNSCIE